MKTSKFATSNLSSRSTRQQQLSWRWTWRIFGSRHPNIFVADQRQKAVIRFAKASDVRKSTDTRLLITSCSGFGDVSCTPEAHQTRQTHVREMCFAARADWYVQRAWVYLFWQARQRRGKKIKWRNENRFGRFELRFNLSLLIRRFSVTFKRKRGPIFVTIFWNWSLFPKFNLYLYVFIHFHLPTKNSCRLLLFVDRI